MRIVIRVAAGLLATISMSTTWSWAQEAEGPPGRRAMSQAAGYKAQFTCSGLFNAGKSLEQIAAHELTNIYPDYGPAMALLPDAEVDSDAKLVKVTYAEDMAPRVAAWRPHLGCASLPPGAVDPSILARAGASKPSRSAEALWPHGDRLPEDDLPADVDVAALEATFNGAFAGEFGGVTSAVVVVQDGRLVGERYLDGFDITTSQRTWSVAKSIGATVIGAAVEDGLVSVDQPAVIDQWSVDGDPRGAVTLANLLHMSSGLDSEPVGSRTDAIYFGGGLVTDHATGNLLAGVPGELWQYANNDTMLALLTLRQAMGDDAAYMRYPFENVLYKIGMLNTNLETDWQGNFILSSQVWTTARDLARLGMLYLQDGVWDGERILPEGWADYVATPAPAQPPGADERPSHGYGAQFWLYQGYPGVPDGTYAALGNRGQFVIIVPERNVVIVRRGYDYRGERFDGPAFTAAVLEAL
ncbi:MAG: serine hydrolase [Pseudomonadota bacterium]